MALGTLYPFGYAAPGASQYLATLMARPRTLLVDICYEAWSRRKEWNPSSLRHRYGKRYRSLGDADITNPVASTASSIEEILIELDGTKVPERSGRALDHETEDAFERLRVAGYL